MAPKVLRDYQRECIDASDKAFARKDGIVIHLPTGAGKTYVASNMIAKEFKQAERHCEASFIFVGVPTRALVDQQCEAIKEDLMTFGIECEYIALVKKLEEHDRTKLLKRPIINTLYVATQAKLNALLICPTPFRYCRMIVIDECHQTHGGHPSADLVKCAWRYNDDNKENKHVKIFGLTASYNNGARSGLDVARRNITDAFRGIIFNPPSYKAHNEQNHIEIPWCEDVQPRKGTSQFREICRHLKKFFPNLRFTSIEVQKKIEEFEEIFNVIGYLALVRMLCADCEKIKTSRILNVEWSQKNLKSDKETTRFQTVFEVFEIWVNDLPLAIEGFYDHLAEPLIRKDIKYSNCKYLCKKVIILLKKIEEAYDFQTLPVAKYLIFVTKRMHVDALSSVLNSMLLTKYGHPKAIERRSDRGENEGYVFSVKGTDSDSKRDGTIRRFKETEGLAIMVATDALECGIDIPAIKIVFLYDECTTTRAFIQRSGRARDEKPLIYVFANNVEEKKAAVWEMEQSIKKSSRPTTPTSHYPGYPLALPFARGEIYELSLTKALEKLNELLQKVYGKTNNNDVGPSCVLQSGKGNEILAARYPAKTGPDSEYGWKYLNEDQVNQIWERNVGAVSPRELHPNVKTTMLVKRKWAFVWILCIHEHGLINAVCGPTWEFERASTHCRLNEPWQSPIRNIMQRQYF